MLNTELALESAIHEDKSLSEVGRAMLLNGLIVTSQAIKLISSFIDRTYRELIKSNHTQIKSVVFSHPFSNSGVCRCF